MEIAQASIINRSGRPYWYVRYLEDGIKKETSTKIAKTEKTLKYMQQRYLPAFVISLSKETKRKVVESKKFADFASIFLSNYQKNDDYQNVKYRMDRILIVFAEVEIDTIKKLQVRQFIENLKNGNSGKEVSKNTRLKYLRIFRGVFELAEEAEVIEHNLVKEMKLAGSNRTDAITTMPFSKQEVQVLLEKSQDRSRYGELLHDYLGIAFNQGMSPAEIIGLQVGDIDLKKQQISIKRNVTKGKMKATKTAYRDRTIPLFSGSIPYIQKLLNEAKVKSSIWLFSDEEGEKLYDIKNIRGTRLIVKEGKVIKENTGWYLLLKDYEFKYRAMKNCRHTFAVTALESKMFTIQEVANILGHGSLQMLIKHYARYINNKAMDADRTIDLFGDSLGDTLKNKS